MSLLLSWLIRETPLPISWKNVSPGLVVESQFRHLADALPKYHSRTPSGFSPDVLFTPPQMSAEIFVYARLPNTCVTFVAPPPIAGVLEPLSDRYRKEPAEAVRRNVKRAHTAAFVPGTVVPIDLTPVSPAPVQNNSLPTKSPPAKAPPAISPVVPPSPHLPPAQMVANLSN